MRQDGRVAAAGRFDEGEGGLVRQTAVRHARKEALAAALRQQLRKAADGIERAVGREPALVQRLHGKIRVDEQGRAGAFWQVHGPAQAGDEGIVENAVVKGLLRAVIVYHAHGAKSPCLTQEGVDTRRILHEQAHLEQLIVCAVFLRAEVGDIEAEALDAGKDVRHPTGDIAQLEFEQHDAFFRAAAAQIADRRELLVRLGQLLPRALGLDEDRVGIDGLVVADAGDVDAQRGQQAAGREKGPDVVGDGGHIGLFHARDRSFTTSPAMMSPATDGTKAVLPGISRRSVHVCFAPGGQMQWLRQLMDISSMGRVGISSE